MRWAACAVSLAIGLAFIFVRAPHPWGWEGFDDYRNLALALARGERFPTLEVPWGYPAFLAFFYRTFGDRQWVPLVAQALLNASIPLMVHAAIRRRIGEREAGVAASIVGVFSFNTVYASTQTSDSLCTFLYVAIVVLLLRGQEIAPQRRAMGFFVAAGVVTGIAMQVRPNLLLLPPWIAFVGFLLVRPRLAPRHLAAFAAVAYVLLVPWIVRNQQLTGRFIPASVHGGIQLWYGSLQVPPYFPNWFDNPRQIFGERTFPSSVPDGRDHIVDVFQPGRDCGAETPRAVTLTYWTDRRPAPVTVPQQMWRPDGVTFAIPPQPADTAIYYYVDSDWPAADGRPIARQTPVAGPIDPQIHFVTATDFGDADRHGDLIDLFDIVSLVRHQAWNEPFAHSGKLDLDRDGTLTQTDLDIAVGVLNSNRLLPIAVPVRGLVRDVRRTDAAATLVFSDDSTLTVPRAFSGRTLDLDFRGKAARDLINSRRSLQSFVLAERDLAALRGFVWQPCHVLDAAVDRVFYRAQPQGQDRYMRLALDDIARTPIAYAFATARRMAGIFITVGSSDAATAHQFSFSRILYLGATLLSVVVFVLFVSGAVVAWRRGIDITLLLAAVLYVPVTIAPFLTNARYSVSGQPFVLAFVAVALCALADRVSGTRRSAPIA